MLVNSKAGEIFLKVPNVTDLHINLCGESVGQEAKSNQFFSPTKKNIRIDSYTQNQDSRIAEPVIGIIHNAIVLTNGYFYSKNEALFCQSFLLGFVPKKKIEIPMNTAIGTKFGITPGKLKPFNLAIEVSSNNCHIVGKYFCSDIVHSIADKLDKSNIDQFKATLESLHWIIDRKAPAEETLRSSAYRYKLDMTQLKTSVNQHLTSLSPEKKPCPFY